MAMSTKSPKETARESTCAACEPHIGMSCVQTLQLQQQPCTDCLQHSQSAWAVAAGDEYHVSQRGRGRGRGTKRGRAGSSLLERAQPKAVNGAPMGPRASHSAGITQNDAPAAFSEPMQVSTPLACMSLNPGSYQDSAGEQQSMSCLDAGWQSPALSQRRPTTWSTGPGLAGCAQIHSGISRSCPALPAAMPVMRLDADHWL